MARKRPRRVSECGKTRYRDADEAKHALALIRAKAAPGDTIPFRWYEHDKEEGGCGGVHLSSHEG